MLILFDQGIPVPVSRHLPHHTVRTASHQGWATLGNGELLRPADPTTLLITAAVLPGIVLGAALLPAFRAARIAPATALRIE